MRTNGWDEIIFIVLQTLYALIHDSTEPNTYIWTM